MTKQHIRHAIAGRLKELSDKDRQADSRSLCRRVAELLPTKDFVICGFMPMPDEVDIRPLLRGILKKEVPLYLPRFEDEKLVFRRAENLKNLVPGAFNIPEPPADAELLDPTAVTHILVPGRAFDRQGNRLGRGNGGYDHFIAAHRKINPQTQFIGVCYELQLVDRVPTEPHDEAVDRVVTARGEN